MKLKSILIFLIIIGVLVSIAPVSAEDNLNGISSDAILTDSYNGVVSSDSSNEVALGDSSTEVDLTDSSLDDTDYSNRAYDEKLLSDGEYHSFEELNQTLSEAIGEVNLTCDYKYKNGSIVIYGDENLTINGNNHIIEGVTDPNFFEFSSNVTVNNLTFLNCNGVSFLCQEDTTFNNVNFINCSGGADGFISCGSTTELNNCVFRLNDCSTPIIGMESVLIVNNSLFSGGNFNESTIYINRGYLTVENSVFENISSNIGSAINFKGWNLTVRNSRFHNLHAFKSGGAILAKFFPKKDYKNNSYLEGAPYLIENCEFVNVSSNHDGGAIYWDMDSASKGIVQILNIINDSFTNCQSRFGGAIGVIGGCINISDSIFDNNSASFKGGAIYTSWADLNIADSTISNSTALRDAGAIYFDKGKILIKDSKLINNIVSDGSNKSANAIYALDSELDFSNSTFDNGGISVYANFAADSKLENIDKNDDIFLLNNTDYVVSVESKGIKINLTNNSIAVDKLPSKFDLRDFGWISPVRFQGDNDDCWAFATAASMESSLLRSTGVLYNLSENYIQKMQLKYYPQGDRRISLTGFSYSGLGNALSWYGALSSDNTYDDRGMIADTDLDIDRIHLQDAMIIFGGRNDTNDLIKQAILKYGPVVVQEIEGEPFVINDTGGDISIMDHATHFVSFIGWDDDYMEEPIDGDSDEDAKPGVWLVKDSILGFFNLSYYHSNLLGTDYYAMVPQRAGICYIFENDIDYHVNYQTDLTSLTGFDENNSYYSNEFTSRYDEFIGAVGTCFNGSGIDYSFDIYLNSEKVYSQSGISEFAGFRTIVLDKYIPVKVNDTFKVVFKSNAVPYQAFSREHYLEGISFVSSDNSTWTDLSTVNKTVCLKVYTVGEDKENQSSFISTVIECQNMTTSAVASVDGRVGEYFKVRLKDSNGSALANKPIKIGFNGKVYDRTTDENGSAKLQINLGYKGTYTFAIGFLGDDDYSGAFEVAKITVKVQTPKLTASNKSYKASAKTKSLSATFKSLKGNPVVNKKVTFTVNGKTYTAKTNSRGIATVNVSLNKKGTYSFTVKFAGDNTFSTVSKKAKLSLR